MVRLQKVVKRLVDSPHSDNGKAVLFEKLLKSGKLDPTTEEDVQSCLVLCVGLLSEKTELQHGLGDALLRHLAHIQPASVKQALSLRALKLFVPHTLAQAVFSLNLV